MVARSRRNSLCCDWRPYNWQCKTRYQSGGGFYRYLFGSVGLPGGAAHRRAAFRQTLPARLAQGLMTILCLGLMTSSPAIAQDNIIVQNNDTTQSPKPPAILSRSLINPNEKRANIEAAIRAYQTGNFLQAASLSKTAFNAGSLDAAVLLGHMHQTGEIGAQDWLKARQWYEKAAVNSHIDALQALAQMGLAGQAGLSRTEGIGYLSRAADRGHVESMLVLSDLYSRGDGVAQNDSRAREYLTRAAENFNVEANKRLGDSYLKSDAQKALTHYETAASAGHIEAAYIAGVMYAENFDIRPNAQRSAQWLKKAALGGHAAAQADYGLLVYQGNGTKRSEIEAAQWFEKSARGGDSEGQFLYAFTLAKGEGLDQDFEEAYFWLLQSADNGVDDYDQDRKELRKRLEDNVDAQILERARNRVAQSE